MLQTFDISNYEVCQIKQSKLKISKVYIIRLQRYQDKKILICCKNLTFYKDQRDSQNNNLQLKIIFVPNMCYRRSFSQKLERNHNFQLRTSIVSQTKTPTAFVLYKFVSIYQIPILQEYLNTKINNFILKDSIITEMKNMYIMSDTQYSLFLPVFFLFFPNFSSIFSKYLNTFKLHH